MINSKEIPAGVFNKEFEIPSFSREGSGIPKLKLSSYILQLSLRSKLKALSESSGALGVELGAPSGQQENSETGSYEGVSETQQPFPGLPVALLFWFWSLLLLEVTFYCRVLPWTFADAAPEYGITDRWVCTWIFISCAPPSHCPVHT